jgi:hypothetical protein
MPESIGDLVALVLGLVLLWLMPGWLSSGARTGRRQASRRPPGHRARPMPRQPSLSETSDLGDEAEATPSSPRAALSPHLYRW